MTSRDQSFDGALLKGCAAHKLSACDDNVIVGVKSNMRIHKQWEYENFERS